MVNKSLIFDLDGTLIDSSGDIVESLKHAYHQAGHNDVVDIPKSLLGPTVSEMVRILTPHIRVEVCDKIVKGFREIYDSSQYTETFLFEDVLTILDKCRSDGVRLFIVTNKLLYATKRILNILKIEQYFQYVATPDCIANVKMNKKEMLDHTIDLNGLNKADTIMIGDSASDVEAAHLTGIKSIGFTGGFGDRLQLVNSQPTFLVESIQELQQLLSEKI